MASRWGVALLAVVVALLGAVVAWAGAPSLVVGQPFTFAGSLGGVAAAGLGADGTAWVVRVEGSDPAHRDGFTVSAQASGGKTMPAAFVTTADETLVDAPTLAVSDGIATVVWLTVDGRTVTVAARRCTLSGCQGVQILARWSASVIGLWNGGSAFAVPEPVVASAGSRAVVVFARFGVPHPLVMWAQSDGSRFGASQSFGVSGNYDPAIVNEPDGRIFAAWFQGGGPQEDAFGEYYGTSIEWTQWSSGQGFSRVHTTSAGQTPGFPITCADLTAAATSTGVTLAWLQGSNSGYSIEGPPFLPVWATGQRAGAFSKPADVFPSGASSISLAGASHVVALGVGTVRPLHPRVAFPAFVATSVNGGPFGTPVALYPAAGPPSVSVDSTGDVLATLFSDPTQARSTDAAQLTIAAPGGEFGAPTELDIGVSGSEQSALTAPLIDTVGQRSFIASTSAAAEDSGSATTFGVFATP
jgi:hypothetical protein